MPTFTSQTPLHVCLPATFTFELPSSEIRCPAIPFKRRAMSVDARARRAAPFACDKAVWTYKRTPFRRTTRRTGTLPTTARSLACNVAARVCRLRATASAVLTCFRRFPLLRFPLAMRAKKQCYTKGHTCRWQPVPARPTSSPQVSGVPTPLSVAGPCPSLHTAEHARHAEHKILLQSHKQSQRARRPEHARHAGHTQGKNRTPGPCRTLEPPPKSGSTLENFKIGKNRLNHCDGHPRKPRVPLLPLECLRRPMRPPEP